MEEKNLLPIRVVIGYGRSLNLLLSPLEVQRRTPASKEIFWTLFLMEGKHYFPFLCFIHLVASLTRNLSVVGSNTIKGSRCFLEQDT